MKPQVVSVVVVKDSSLLTTRQMVIAQAGSASRRAFTVRENDDALKREHIRAVVLCYTLSDDEREDIRVLAEGKDPRIVIIEVARTEHSALETLRHYRLRCRGRLVSKSCSRRI